MMKKYGKFYADWRDAHGATPHSFWFSQQFPQPTDEGVCV
jgi:hypothetical protein